MERLVTAENFQEGTRVTIIAKHFQIGGQFDHLRRYKYAILTKWNGYGFEIIWNGRKTIQALSPGYLCYVDYLDLSKLELSIREFNKSLDKLEEAIINGKK